MSYHGSATNLHLYDDRFTDDSDTESDSAATAHYLPITAVSDPDDNDVNTPLQLNGSIVNHPIPSSLHIENGVAELHLDGSERVEEEEEVEREEEVIARAFTEDESRRSVPLVPEAATPTVDAMKGVSILRGVPVLVLAVEDIDQRGRRWRLSVFCVYSQVSLKFRVFFYVFRIWQCDGVFPQRSS